MGTVFHASCFGCELADIEAVEIEHLSCFSFDSGFDLHAEKTDSWGEQARSGSW